MLANSKQKTAKSFFLGGGLCPDPAGGTYNALTNPLVESLFRLILYFIS